MDNIVEKANKSELRLLYEADQADRKPAADGRWDDAYWAEVEAHDAKRLARVREMIEVGLVATADDLYCAAMIYQHSPDISDDLQAHELAKKSVELGGGPPAKYLVAASLDKYLIHIGPTQKYGTQFRCYEGSMEISTG